MRLAVLPRRVLAPAPGEGVGTSFDLNRDFQRELFLDRPTNVLLVKFNYWLSL